MNAKKSIFDALDNITKELAEAEAVVEELKEAKSNAIRDLLDGPLDNQKTFRRKIDGKEQDFMVVVSGGTKKGEKGSAAAEEENSKLRFSIRARNSKDIRTLE